MLLDSENHRIINEQIVLDILRSQKLGGLVFYFPENLKLIDCDILLHILRCHRRSGQGFYFPENLRTN